MAESQKAQYTIYSSPFSLYSMMARHTLQLGPATHGARPPQNITLSFVNHRKNENLREEYLLKVNPKGQVPAMTGNVLERPLTDSLSISIYMAEKHYPAMLPVQHAAVIKDLLRRLHAVRGPAFSNKNPTTDMMKHNPSPAVDILKRTDLSPEYRTALNFKVEYHNKNYGIAFQPAIITKVHTDLRDIFHEIIEHRRKNGASDTEGDWTFGALVGPTVLDSHLLPLVLRCIEAGNADIVPQELQVWADVNVKSPAWQKVMHGRPTVWDPSMGPVEEMQDMMFL
ncbi:hypothetical protein N7462_001725 [Penicillium macrosclerotiorum]|uniref:uncharacterized protein n=1 Tax=Penicillium macrosclerotiorum TaxID=303699 RepID=UPI0025499D7E|nr:uncharacterized protein N7462_001725 [Penicillium macrosclerotiorum]KAJ5692302.1 hypothetical protein N7462_001725 [Penicillium macrosclerotiorum]